MSFAAMYASWKAGEDRSLLQNRQVVDAINTAVSRCRQTGKFAYIQIPGFTISADPHKSGEPVWSVTGGRGRSVTSDHYFDT